MTYVIGIDVGSQSVKAVLLDPEGGLRASAAYPLTMSHPRAGWAEQDPRTWILGLTTVIGEVLEIAGLRGDEVGAIALACQVDGVVPISAVGDPLGPAIIWLDRRAEVQAEALVSALGRERLFEITGLVPDASHSGPKIMWLRENAPDIFAAATALPPCAGFLVRFLTGELVLDHANASSSLLYDLRSRQWSNELLEASGLAPAQLGRVLGAGDKAGTLSAYAATATGLSTSCVVLVGTGDEHAASLGAGAVTPGMVTDVTGTAEPVTVAARELVLDHEGLLETHGHAIDNCYLVENPGFVSGGSTRWLADNLLHVAHPTIFELADAAPPGADGVLFIPALSGAMTPRWNSRMRGAFIGLAMPHSSAHLARAVLEGCAFALRDITERISALGLGDGEIRVVGGGAWSETWMQIKADVTGRPVRRVLVKEASALGAAMLAGVGAGTFSDLDDAVARTVTLADEPFEANPQRSALYDESYAHYRSLYDAVEGELA
ncbi:MAG TPA: FGGY family carbohydrate kinase [Acidimicrobiales bacterium]|nr:FGGY family carbohydrate kinase [Acidimicrobiales bacterium]